MTTKDLIELLTRHGVPTAVAAWLLYEFHVFARELVTNQALILETLRQVVALHK